MKLIEYTPINVEIPEITSVSPSIDLYNIFSDPGYGRPQVTEYTTTYVEDTPQVNEEVEELELELELEQIDNLSTNYSDVPTEHKQSADLRGDLSKEQKLGRFPDNDEGKADFHKTMFRTYQKVLKERGLDPDWAYILTASASIESAYGNSLGAHYNYGGVKVTDKLIKLGVAHMWSMTPDWVRDKNGKLYLKRRLLPFRVYASMEDYCHRVISLLSNKRYEMFKKYKPHEYVKTWYHILDSGYAKSDYEKQMSYARKLGDRVQKVKRNLKN